MQITGGRTSVVLVDDDEDLRFLVRTALELDDRFDVVGEAANGFDAARIAETEQPDLVLLDLEMPWVDGAEAVPHIRRRAPGAIIVLWTVEPYGTRSNEAVELGASQVLDKALVSPMALGATLARVLGIPSVCVTVPSFER
jgi:DNA-binding NarL/FixJ family response regulator